MATARRSQKVFIQLATAFAGTIVVGLIAIWLGFTVFQNIVNNAQSVQQEAKKKAEELKSKEEEYNRKLASINAVPKTYRVVKAIADLKPGQPIAREMLVLEEVRERPPSGSLTMLSQAVGKMVKAPVISGEAIQANNLIDLGGLVTVEKGKRAITIHLNSIAGLNGAVTPGVHVDILATVKLKTENDDGNAFVSKTVLQDVPVVAVAEGKNPFGGNKPDFAEAKSGSPSSGGGLAVTVIVNPKQAELLALAGQVGSLYLTLRNYTDGHKPKLPGTDTTTLLTGLEPLPLGGETPISQSRSGAGKNNAAEQGFHNVNFTPSEDSLKTSTPATPKFSMQIYRGAGSETVDFGNKITSQ